MREAANAAAHSVINSGQSATQQVSTSIEIWKYLFGTAFPAHLLDKETSKLSNPISNAQGAHLSSGGYAAAYRPDSLGTTGGSRIAEQAPSGYSRPNEGLPASGVIYLVGFAQGDLSNSYNRFYERTLKVDSSWSDWSLGNAVGVAQGMSASVRGLQDRVLAVVSDPVGAFKHFAGEVGYFAQYPLTSAGNAWDSLVEKGGLSQAYALQGRHELAGAVAAEPVTNFGISLISSERLLTLGKMGGATNALDGLVWHDAARGVRGNRLINGKWVDGEGLPLPVPPSVGASGRVPNVLQTGGNTLNKSTANGLNEYFGESLTSREWVERLRH